MSDPAAPQRKLTKKEKKAQAFRAAKATKKKAAPSFDDEVNDIDDAEANLALDKLERAPASAAAKSKKRARDDDGDALNEDDGGTAQDKAAQGDVASDEQPKKKKRQRGKTQAQRDREAREAAKGAAGGGDGAHRLLLFVGAWPFSLPDHCLVRELTRARELAGNMPYKVTVDEIKEHFKPCGRSHKSSRLLDPPRTGALTS